MSQSSQKNFVTAAICVVLAALVWLVFGQTLGFEFVNYDDQLNVYENRDITGGLSLNALARAFTSSQIGHWDPLTTISHILDCQIFGLWAGGHHLINVLLHGVAVILLFLVLRQITGALWRSAFVAAVFAIHPLRAESVAWVSERKDVLSGVFFMLIIAAYARYAHKPSLPRYLGALLLFLMGLMSKSMLVTVPFLLLLLDYWPLNRFSLQNSRRLIIEKIPFFILSAAMCVVQLFADSSGIVSMEHIPLSWRLGNAAVSYAAYIGQMFYPLNLAVFYPHPSSQSPVWEIALSLLLAACISAGVFLLRHKKPYLLTGWLWYLGMLVPVIGIIQSGTISRADRYTYLPQIGLYLMIAWLVTDLLATWVYRREILGLVAIAVIAPLLFAARVQTTCWQNTQILWEHTLAVTPNNLLARNNLAKALLQNGRLDEAIDQYEKSLAIRGDDNIVCNSLGIALLQKGRVEEAAAQFQKALELKPDYAEACSNLGNAYRKEGRLDEAISQYQRALQIDPGLAETHFNLGNALREKGQPDEAMIHYQKALKIKPGYAKAHAGLAEILVQKQRVNEAIGEFYLVLKTEPGIAEIHSALGHALMIQGRIDEAVVELQKALEIEPGNATAHYDLGLALMQKRDAKEAITHYEKALAINPGYIQAQNNVAWILATNPDGSLRNGPRAVELALQAERLSGGKDAAVLDTLAAAYAEAGRFPEAITTAQRAVALAGTQGNTALAASVRSEIVLYQADKPFRDTGH